MHGNQGFKVHEQGSNYEGPISFVDKNKLEKEERICRRLKHPNIGKDNPIPLTSC